PSLAIRHCLSAGGVSFADIDRIVFHSTESAYYSQELKRFIYDPRRPFRPTGKELIASLFQDQFQVDVADKIRFCNHHLAHAWSAFGQSGFDDSLILTLDGTGDNSSGLVLIGHGREIQTVREFHDFALERSSRGALALGDPAGTLWKGSGLLGLRSGGAF